MKWTPFRLLAVMVLAVLLWGSGVIAGRGVQRAIDARALASPGFELIEFRVQEAFSLDWARFRIEDGRAVFLGWDQ